MLRIVILNKSYFNIENDMNMTYKGKVALRAVPSYTPKNNVTKCINTE